MDRIVADELQGKGSQQQSFSAAVVETETFEALNPVSEVMSLLHQISTDVTLELAQIACDMWKSRLEAGEEILSSLGETLDLLFTPSESQVSRRLSLPGEHIANRGDMLYLVDDGSEKRLPIFVACAEEQNQVLEMTLSIFIRRGRLPDPGEILFCTAATTLEELSILLMRFIRAKKNRRGHNVFVIADIHNLTYTQQCNLVELLRSMLVEYGQDEAGTLVFISGKPRQMVLSALASNQVELPPLAAMPLRSACEEAFKLHRGETYGVASTINGGGKTHHILASVSDIQKKDDSVMYYKVPIRESTTPQKLIDLFSAAHRLPGRRFVFHIDIAHIIPASANTMLFQLLLVGVLKCPVSCRAFHRNKDDIFFIEIPNSFNNKTAMALNMCALLPTKILSVDAESLQLTRPIFVDDANSQIRCPEYSELIFACKWLRAVKENRLKPGTQKYNAEYSPHTEPNLPASECFSLLRDACANPSGPSPQPSWTIFNSFIMFVNSQFNLLGSYSMLSEGLLDQVRQDSTTSTNSLSVLPFGCDLLVIFSCHAWFFLLSLLSFVSLKKQPPSDLHL